MKPSVLLLSVGLAFSLALAQENENAPVYQQRFEKDTGFTLQGSAKIIDIQRREDENGDHGVALDSSGGGGLATGSSGSVEMVVTGLEGSAGQWFRFSFAGLPEKNFAVGEDADLVMKVKFASQDGTESLDGVVKEIYPMVQADRKDIARNGVNFKNGASAWPRHAFDFRLPFNGIDTLKLIVSFQNGRGQGSDSAFLVDEVMLERIAVPLTYNHPQDEKEPEQAIDPSRLLPLGGKWFYYAAEGEESAPTKFNSRNLDRLVYQVGAKLETPFAMDRGAWLKRGFKDAEGRIVQSDTWVEDAVEVEFTDAAMIIKTSNLPNHTTGSFPGYLRNPNYIQEKDLKFTLPLNPEPDPKARAMTNKNRNQALPMGPTGVAVNGVIFYNPFDAGSEEAVNIMDRCCGHPDPGNFYHYHKYPVCARSPFEDAGKTHSPLIGWAFDGFPVYGPYEGNGEMAMDSKTNPLNEFNIHRDNDRGWHYHVTPGKFPYIIGGYWGEVEKSNLMKGPPMGPGGPGGPGGMRGPGGPPPGGR